MRRQSRKGERTYPLLGNAAPITCGRDWRRECGSWKSRCRRTRGNKTGIRCAQHLLAPKTSLCLQNLPTGGGPAVRCSEGISVVVKDEEGTLLAETDALEATATSTDRGGDDRGGGDNSQCRLAEMQKLLERAQRERDDILEKASQAMVFKEQELEEVIRSLRAELEAAVGAKEEL
eukprot:1621041-Pyramimonas_sp.AAC.2